MKKNLKEAIDKKEVIYVVTDHMGEYMLSGGVCLHEVSTNINVILEAIDRIEKSCDIEIYESNTGKFLKFYDEDDFKKEFSKQA